MPVVQVLEPVTHCKNDAPTLISHDKRLCEGAVVQLTSQSSRDKDTCKPNKNNNSTCIVAKCTYCCGHLLYDHVEGIVSAILPLFVKWQHYQGNGTSKE
jgi:hypothetical protein